MTLQTNDRVGYRIMARALPQESQLCHDRSGDAGMQVIFLSFSHSHTHTQKGMGRCGGTKRKKRKGKQKPWLQVLPSGSLTLCLGLFYKAWVWGKPHWPQHVPSEEWGCERPAGAVGAVTVTVSTAVEDVLRPRRGLPELWGCWQLC